MGPQSAGRRSAVEVAVSLHQDGQLAEAESLYRQILSAEPDHHDALHLLGVIELQRGRAQDAVDLISRSLASQPEDFNALNHLGEAYRSMQLLDEAMTCFE